MRIGPGSVPTSSERARSWFRSRVRSAAVAGTLVLVLAGAACGGAASGGGSAAPSSKPAASSAAPAAAAPSSTASSGATGAASSAAPAAKPAPAAKAKYNLTVAYPAPIGAMAPLWIAQAIGAYAKHGVNVKIVRLNSDNAMAALVSGQIDALEISPPSFIPLDLRQPKSKAIMVASALNHPIIALYAEASIKNAADLKGKKMASDRPMTATSYAAQQALNLLGLKTSDVQLIPVGGSAPSFQALLSGQVQAALLAPPFSQEAVAKGYHLLQSLASIPYENVGIVIMQSRLSQLTPALVPFLEAYQEGIKAFSNQSVALKVLQQYTKQNKAGALEQWNYYNKLGFETSMQPNIAGIQGMLNFYAEGIPQAKTATPQDFLNLSLLKKISGS